MKAVTRGIIGAVIGLVVMGLMAFNAMTQGGNGITLEGIACIPVGALYGFGFAFGWQYLKSITSKLLGVASGVSFFTILTSRENTFVKVFFIYLFAIALAVGIAWIPGIVKGIKSIIAERQAV